MRGGGGCSVDSPCGRRTGGEGGGNLKYPLLQCGHILVLTAAPQVTLEQLKRLRSVNGVIVHQRGANLRT